MVVKVTKHQLNTRIKKSTIKGKFVVHQGEAFLSLRALGVVNRPNPHQWELQHGLALSLFSNRFYPIVETPEQAAANFWQGQAEVPDWQPDWADMNNTVPVWGTDDTWGDEN